MIQRYTDSRTAWRGESLAASAATFLARTDATTRCGSWAAAAALALLADVRAQALAGGVLRTESGVDGLKWFGSRLKRRRRFGWCIGC